MTPAMKALALKQYESLRRELSHEHAAQLIAGAFKILVEDIPDMIGSPAIAESSAPLPAEKIAEFAVSYAERMEKAGVRISIATAVRRVMDGAR